MVLDCQPVLYFCEEGSRDEMHENPYGCSGLFVILQLVYLLVLEYWYFVLNFPETYRRKSNKEREREKHLYFCNCYYYCIHLLLLLCLGRGDGLYEWVCWPSIPLPQIQNNLIIAFIPWNFKQSSRGKYKAYRKMAGGHIFRKSEMGSYNKTATPLPLPYNQQSFFTSMSFFLYFFHSST